MVRALSTPPLVGRDAIIEVVERRLEELAARRGAVLLLDGAAGVGKSRVLNAVADRARSGGIVVLRGSAVEGGGAYRPVSQALLGYLRDAELPEAPELRPFQAALARIVPGWDGIGAAQPGVDPVVVLGEGMVRLLRRLGDGAGCLLVLDDLHWADVDTVALVEFLAGAVGSSPVLVVGASRSGEPVGDPLHRLRRHAGVTTATVARLDDADVELVAAGCLGGAVPGDVMRYVIEHADGLPLMVEELLVGLVDAHVLVPKGGGWDVTRPPTPTVPPTMAGLVAGRLAELDPEARRVLAAAAVVGRDVDWTLLGPATSLPEALVLDALRAAHEHHLLGSDGATGRVRWVHALTRHAVLAQVNAADQAVLARSAAQVVEERGLGDDALLAADLHELGGDHRRAAGLLRALAGRAAAAGALGTADEHLARAMTLDPALSGLLADRVRVLALAGRAGEATRLGEPALRAARGDEHVELCLALARAALADGRWEDAARCVERAHRPDDAAAVAIAADVAFGAGDPIRAAALAARAVSLAESDERPEELCAALEVVGRCDRETDPTNATAAFRRAAQVAAEHGLDPAHISALIGLGSIDLLVADDPTQLVHARELATDAGMLRQACAVDLMLADRTMLTDGPVTGALLATSTAELAGDLQLTGLQAMAELLSALGPAATGDRGRPPLGSIAPCRVRTRLSSRPRCVHG